MATFTKQIDSGLRMVRDNYISIRTPNWVATENVSSLAKYAEEEPFPGEYYGGIINGSFRFTGVTIPSGAVITSAKITFYASSSWGWNSDIDYKIVGVDEDNTAEFNTGTPDTARTRTHTTAVVDWTANINPTSQHQPYDSPDISSVIQEIIDRGGWSSGNALGIYFYNDATANDEYINFGYYSSYPSYTPLLTITYEVGSASLSPSSSASPSKSPSASASPSSSASPSPSASASSSPSPSPAPDPISAVMKIGKPEVNVLTNSDIEKLKFSSEYGTLKYFDKQSLALEIDASTGDISCVGSYSHNLGYYPFIECYVSVYIGAPTGVYEYCPFVGSGASVQYGANVKLTETGISVYGAINGMSTSVWHFDFIFFIFKNDLKLS